MTSAGTMVERVARALCEANGVDPDTEGPWELGDHEYKIGWKFFESQARAAIEAMREPTLRMKCDGYLVPTGPEPDIDTAEAIWQAMIDAALSEGEG
jgi:hypothetical protein